MSKNKISKKQLMIIAQNLGQIYKDGIPINQGIDLISETIHHKEYRRSLEKVSSYMKDGLSLSESFKKFSELYPPFFTGLISIGENTGKLYEVLYGISVFYEKYSFITDSVKSACIYPIFVFTSMMFLFILLMEKINPSFYDIYKSMNINPPDSCSFLYDIKQFFEQNYYMTAVGVICWGIVSLLIIRYLYSKIRIESFKRFKVVRNIIEYITVLLFSILCSTGINISYGLKYCEDSISPEYLNERLKKVNKNITQGKGLTESLEKSDLLSKYTLSIIRIREESGTISEGFKEIADSMEEKISKEIKKYLSLIPPVFVVIMAVCIIVFLLVFVIPLYDSLQMGIIR
ncbi:MAG: type II secretion system F family protein [Clostridium sp.]|nr:type II secretion system F family protein [Clostridium sp.]